MNLLTNRNDWKKLRNLYLRCQREKLKKLHKPAASLAIPAHSINFYGARQEQEAREAEEEIEERARQEKRQKLLESRPSFSYIPGMIVKISFQVPCPDINKFKKEMRQNPDVCYVDIQEGSSIAYVRTASMKCSEEFIKNVGTPEMICCKLTGTYETLYWEKITIDRANKLTKNINVDSSHTNEGNHTAVGPKHVRFTE